MTSRSTYGCWTCRVRKKKCDEHRPSCFKCGSLKLDCDGYGPRPHWMDRGELEREKARKLKRIISQIKSSIRQQKLLHTLQDVRTEVETPAIKNIDTSRLYCSDSTHQIISRSGFTPENNLQPPSKEGDLYTSSEPIWSEPFQSADFHAESFYDQIFGICTYNQLAIEASQRVSMGILTGADEKSNRSSIDISTQNAQLKTDMEIMIPLCDTTLSTFNHGFFSSMASTYNKEEESSLLTQKNSSSGFAHLVSRQAQLADSILCGDVEDTLFMYYFDHVFYIHCPFYFPTNQRGRGWLFSILKRVKSAYHAALALSEYHQSTIYQHNSYHLPRLRGRHYDLALQEMQASLVKCNTWSENLGLVHNIEALTSILLLLFYELFNGGKRNWHTHLRAATALFPPLVQAKIAAIQESHLNQQQDGVISKPEDYTSISFLLGFFISMDILSCASTRSSHILTLDHKLLLERGEINLVNLTGCSNWAMAFIFEISLLDKWREEEKNAHKLSLVELTKRGSHIEECIRRRLADIEKGYLKRDPHISELGMLPDSNITEITRIFALSAITYLHVVISGAYPELPEIMESVSKTIDALQNLPDPKLLRNVVWPFCVSGCLAVDGQQNLFRELMSAAHITQFTVGTCLEAFQIMEDCWESRRAGSCNYDWVCSMKKGASIFYSVK